LIDQKDRAEKFLIAILSTMTGSAVFPATLNALFTAQEVFTERGLV
jgi:hypothetical protein